MAAFFGASTGNGHRKRPFGRVGSQETEQRDVRWCVPSCPRLEEGLAAWRAVVLGVARAFLNGRFFRQDPGSASNRISAFGPADLAASLSPDASFRRIRGNR